MSQFWAGGEVERQPSSESIRGALRTLPWGWWVSAQPMAVPWPPSHRLLHAGAVAVAQ